jgi:TatD family-associated radical SAM protein
MTKQASSVVYWLGDNVYLNITNRCTNNCCFCFRNYKNGINGFNLKLTEEPTTDQIVTAIREVINKKSWKEIVFCGFGEPLTRLDTVLEVSRQIKKQHANVIRVDTNGQAQLINKNRNVVKELKQAGVDKVSVSLNAHNKQTYDEVCKPKFENAFTEVLNFIKKAKEEKMDTEITAVTIPEVDIVKMQEIAAGIGVKFRIRQYTPCFW